MASKKLNDIFAEANQDLENNNDPNNNSSDNEDPSGLSDPLPGPSNSKLKYQGPEDFDNPRPGPSRPRSHFQGFTGPSTSNTHNEILGQQIAPWNLVQWLKEDDDNSRSLNSVFDQTKTQDLIESRKRLTYEGRDVLDMSADMFHDASYNRPVKRKFPPPSCTVTSADVEGLAHTNQNNHEKEGSLDEGRLNLPGPSGLNGKVKNSKKNARKGYKRNSAHGSKCPEVITLTDSPPQVSDFDTQSDTAETVANLTMMFPNTPIEYLRYGATKIVAETPEYFDWFVFDLGSRNGLPPNDWASHDDVQIVSETDPSGQSKKKRSRKSDNRSKNADDVFTEIPSHPPSTSQEIPVLPSEEEPINEIADVQTSQETTQEEAIASKFEMLCSLFPRADPNKLYEAVELLRDEATFSAWVSDQVETNGNKLGSRDNYDKHARKAKLQEKLDAQVSVTDLVATFEDPERYFLDTSRSTSNLYKQNVLNQLKKDFDLVHVTQISKAFQTNFNLYLPSFLALKNAARLTLRKYPRGPQEVPNDEDFDDAFLKERQYVLKRDEVQHYILNRKYDRENRFQEARRNGLLRECDCCASDDCLTEEMLSCEGGHDYCVECIKRASNVAIGDGKTELKCLMHCEKTFSLATLQKVLSPNTFSKWLQRIQLEELKKADIEGLETCPFCTFATIIDFPAEDFKVFTCLNPDCGKESCRLCKEKSHIPLRCHEVERDNQVQMRTYIENKMTEALVRKCYKCSKPYVKVDGCNKILCTSCGSRMCYICRKPVKDYSHFYGQGAKPSANSLCPLWSDNKTIHDQDVARGALEAKEQVQKEQPGVELKFDPTKGLNLQKAPLF